MDLETAMDMTYKWLDSPSKNASEEKLKSAVDTFIQHLQLWMPMPYEDE